MLLVSCMFGDINPSQGDPNKRRRAVPKSCLPVPPETLCVGGSPLNHTGHSDPRMLSRWSTPVPSPVGSPVCLLNYDSRKLSLCDGFLTLRRQQLWRLPGVDLKVRGVSKSVRSRPGSPGPRCCARYFGSGAFRTIES